MQKPLMKKKNIFNIAKSITKYFEKISLSNLFVRHNIGKINKCIPKLKTPLVNNKFWGRTNLYVSNILLIISPIPKIIFLGTKNNILIIKFSFIIEVSGF